MRVDIHKYVKSRVSERIAERRVPYAVYLHEITNLFGIDSLSVIREMVKGNELFFQQTINTVVISTIPVSDIWDYDITEHP